MRIVILIIVAISIGLVLYLNYVDATPRLSDIDSYTISYPVTEQNPRLPT